MIAPRHPPRRARGVREAASTILVVLTLAATMGTATAATPIPGLGPTPGARTAEAPPPAPAAEDVRELARLLADPGLRAWLEREAMREARADAGTVAGESPQLWLRARLEALGRELTIVRAAWSDAPRAIRELGRALATALGEGGSLRTAIYVIVFLVVGAGVEWLYWRYAGDAQRRIEREAYDGTERSIGRTALRAVLGAVGIALFAAGTIGAFLAFEWPALAELMVLSILLAVVTVRVVSTVAVFVLCPRVPVLRPLPIETPVARFAYRWTMAIAAVATFGGYATMALEQPGLVPQAAVIVRSATGTLVAALAIAALWRWQALFVCIPGVRRVRGDLATLLFTVVIVAAWALWLGHATAIAWTLVLVAAIPLLDGAARGITRAAIARRPAATAPAGDPLPGSPASAEDGAAAPDIEEVPAPISAAVLWGPVIERLLRFVIVIAAAVTATAAWGVDPWSLSRAPTPLGRAAGAVIDVAVAYLIADLVWTWARTAIDARMASYRPPEPGHAPGPEARLVTLLPLLRKLLMVTLLAMVSLLALASLGVNVAPLLAGAGVVGIAVGFGAQTLVRDIVSGIFFLLDDAFRVGEYIEIDNLRGTVESISVRSLRLRHHRGAVHTIPFGEIKSLTNHSRDWVILKLEFRVPFETDLKLVKKLVKNIGAELAQDPEIAPDIIEAPKSQGVRRMEEFNMVVGVKFMTKPGGQWTLRKEVFQRVRDAFDAHGIRFAERNVKVEVLGSADLSPEQRAAAIAAAEPAIERAAGPPKAVPDTP